MVVFVCAVQAEILYQGLVIKIRLIIDNLTGTIPEDYDVYIDFMKLYFIGELFHQKILATNAQMACVAIIILLNAFCLRWN